MHFFFEMKQTSGSAVRHNKPKATERELKRYGGYVRRNLLRHISFPQRHNARYHKNDILDVLLHAQSENVCLETASKTIQSVAKTDKPSADSVLRYLGKLEQTKVLDMFQRTNGYIFKVAKKYGVFRREVDIAVDFQDVHFYGSKNLPYVVETKMDRGTGHFFRYLTVSIVDKGRRFVLKVMPVHKLDLRHHQLEELLTYVRSKFKVRYVYFDRGFYDSKILMLMNQLGFKYIIKCPLNSKVRKLTNKKQKLPVVLPYYVSDRAFSKLVVVNMRNLSTDGGKDFRVYYITNIPVAEESAQVIDNLYRRRWCIETSFRVQKHSLRIKTTSRNHVIRLFLYLFGAMVYNLWYLGNITVGASARIAWIKPFIQAKVFIVTLLHIYVPPP